jgi:hypothetical protein
MEPDMSTARSELDHLLGTGMGWALAATLLASVGAHGTPDGLTCGAANRVEAESSASPDHVDVTCPEKFYTLGGTISGLTRTGLVLANGTHGGPVPANSTSFTLPTPVAYKTSYAVTVATQPAGLTCSVGNGSGVMPARNLTSVKLKCLENAYAFGGTARDLNPTALVLLLGLARSTRSSRD